MPVLRLIRHAQATYASELDDALTELGLRQSALLDAALVDDGVLAERIAVGSLRRQAATVLACRRSVTKAPSVDPRWDEYAAADVLAHHGVTPTDGGPRNSLGAPPALTPREFQALLDAALARWIEAGERSPCAESWPAFQTRVRAALSDLVAGLERGAQALAFTSGGVIAAAGATLLAAPAATFLALNRVSVNSAITTVISGRAGLRLLTFNDHSHIEHDRALITFR
jgi:broad specificity phosphatase PhoE